MAKSKRTKSKSWRHYIVNGMAPPKYELIERYDNLITSVVNIITGSTGESKSLTYWFYKSISLKLFGQTKDCTPHTYLLSRTLIDNMLSKEDIEQQAWLYLAEMWEHYVDTYKHNQVARFVFYDYVRFNLIKYMSSWTANQIHINVADYKAPDINGVIHMEEPDQVHMDLGWVILKSETSFLSNLSVRQKYLIFLRYVKQMSILEISKLTQRNHKSIEKDFTIITRAIKAGDFYEHPSKSN